MRSAVLVLVLVIACGSAPPLPPPAPVLATADAAAEIHDAPLADSVTIDAAPEPVACTTDDDCWADGNKPIARPKSERGRKLRSCRDSELIPVCKANVCAINAFKC